MLARIGVAAWLAAVACTEVHLGPGGGGGDDDDDSESPLPPEPDPPAVRVEAPPGFDPLRAPLGFEVHASPAAEVTVDVVGENGAVVWSTEGTANADGVFAGSWTGQRDRGEPALAGEYRLRAEAGGDGAEAPFALVRTGFVAAWLEGDGGATATREPLYWPVTRSLQDASEPVARVPGIDDGAVALDFPEVPPGPLAVRPEGAEPAAFVYDGRPILTLEVADRAGDGGPTGLDAADVVLEVDGWTVLDGVPLVPGETVVLQRDEPLGDTVGVSALTLELGFRIDDHDLGAQVLPLRIYRLLDVSAFTRPQPHYRPWTPVVEQALVSIDGTPAEPYEVVDALVDFVFHDLGLTYDTAFGASAYSQYDGWSLSDPHFLLSDFLVRRFGSVINCSDAGNILGAYANMVGARLDHVILAPAFELNQIRAIGTTQHTRCPFGPGGCAFNYHAVTTVPGSNAVWDATLALDGDADPRTTPSTDLFVQTIDSGEYLDRLVRSGDPEYQLQAQETLE